MVKTSDEQSEIIKASQELLPETTMKVDACAGSGKTTTLIGIAKANPDKRFLYLAFNRSIADNAKRIFPSNTICKTIHSLAYGHFFGGGRRKQRKPYFAEIKVDMLRDHFSRVDSEGLYKILLEYKKFLNSSDLVIPSAALRRIFKLVEEGSLPMPHDHYLKCYQMLKAEERGLEKNFDCILVDESQDSNPVTIDIVNTAHCIKIYVGDTHQSIYGFRGAINALRSLRADVELRLTNSFRSTQEILDKANLYMTTYHDLVFRGELPYVPMHSMATKDSMRNDKTAYITRTNAALVELIDEFRGHPQSVWSVKRAFDIFQAPINVYEFLYKRKRNFMREYKFMNSLKNLEELQDYAEKVHDYEILTAIKIAKRYQDDLYNLRRVAEIMEVQTDANIVLTNAHTSKGMEWRRVELQDDFPDLSEVYASCLIDNRGRQPQSQEEAQFVFNDFIQELDLYYVAITRAQEKLVDLTKNAKNKDDEAIRESVSDSIKVVSKRQSKQVKD